ncbi:hypothetical protein TNCV_103981 [Trichonephila clavipes]|nr:hypothetical protein TNCV_103981 [Trichonephila clavipes]
MRRNSLSNGHAFYVSREISRLSEGGSKRPKFFKMSHLHQHERTPKKAGERKAARGLLATDHVILNHGQVTWTTPELAPTSPNYHTTQTGGRFSSRQI